MCKIRLSNIYILLRFLAVLPALAAIVAGCSRSEEKVEYENIHRAAFHGDIKAVKGFLAEGVPVDDMGDSGTPLHNAVKNNQVEMVEFLLENRANVSLRQPRLLSYETPLHSAAGEGYFRIVELLIRYGADVNAQKSLAHISGLTPLHEVVLSRQVTEEHFKIAKILLENGADVNARAVMGEETGTPLHAAVERGHAEIAQLLRHYGGME